MRLKRPTHATVVAYLALFFAMSGTAVAATGGTFILGRSNGATATTGLTNTAGTALKLTSKSGYAPLSVGSNKVKVPYLNSDMLDGLDSTWFLKKLDKAADSQLLDGLDSAAFQRTVSSCSGGEAIQTVNSLGWVTCANIPQLSGAEFLTADGSCPTGSSYQASVRLESSSTSGVYYTRILCRLYPY